MAASSPESSTSDGCHHISMDAMALHQSQGLNKASSNQSETWQSGDIRMRSDTTELGGVFTGNNH